MGYVIFRVQKASQTDCANAEEPILSGSYRASIGDSSIIGPGWDKFSSTLNKLGFAVLYEIAKYDPKEYDLTVIAYTSKKKSGDGRCGSSLYRLPAKRIN